MMHPCPFKVYKRNKGGKQAMIARFADRTEAVNYAIEVSKGRWNFLDVDVVVYDHEGRVCARFHRGVRA